MAKCLPHLTRCGDLFENREVRSNLFLLDGISTQVNLVYQKLLARIFPVILISSMALCKNVVV